MNDKVRGEVESLCVNMGMMSDDIVMLLDEILPRFILLPREGTEIARLLGNDKWTVSNNNETHTTRQNGTLYFVPDGEVK